MSNRLLICAVLLLALASVCSAATLTLPAFFSDHMVLQRDKPATIWGKSAVGDVVHVEVAGQSQMATADATGLWIVLLDPVAAGGPYEVTVKSASSGATVVFADVLFGDVFLCAGQSNMELTVSHTFNASAEIADSVNYPGLHVFETAKTYAYAPAFDMETRGNLQWQPASPSSIGNSDQWGYYSATCYYFGRSLYKHFNGKVPIGLVTSAWGGTCVESWSSPDALGRCSTTMHHDGAPLNSSALFNAELAPFTVGPMTFSGMVWYQGEANADDADNYACRFPAFIRDMRYKLGNSQLPFVYVELAPYSQSEQFASLRAAQAAALALPHVGRTSVLELGDSVDNPEGAIHPRYKQQAGARTALQMLTAAYGVPAVETTGPVPFALHASATNTFLLVAEQAAGAYLNETNQCTTCCSGEHAGAPSVTVEVQTSGSSAWQPTTLSLLFSAGTQATFSVTLAAGVSVDSVTSLRYAWRDWPNCLAFNSLGLPMSPFQLSLHSSALQTGDSVRLVRSAADPQLLEGAQLMHNGQPKAAAAAAAKSSRHMQHGRHNGAKPKHVKKHARKW